MIATPVGGVSELVQHERTGLVVAPGSVADLADAIERIATDDELRESLAARAYESVWTRFDDASTMDALVSLIESEAKDAARD